MCGLAGELRWDGARTDAAVLDRMTYPRAHRGSDGEGLWSRDPLGSGHRRLPIIELAERGAQPDQPR